MSRGPLRLGGGGGGGGGEFDRLRRIFARLGSRARDLGDDCALIRVGRTTLAVSIDSSLEGVHFRTDWLSWQEIGWRSTAAALSDLAAEGAKPIGVLVSLGVPSSGSRVGGAGRGGRGGDAAVAIMDGVASAAQSVGARVLGGDLVRSPRYLVDVCVLGIARRPVRRAGARPGQGLWVTGALGGAALGLAQLRDGRKPTAALFRRFAHPEPRISAGRWLADRGAAAMIDVSDGLAADAGHLAAASRVRLDIELERIPCWPGVPPAAAAASGEEFELLVVLPQSFGDAAARAFRRATGLALTRIGRCTRGAGLRLTQAGRPVAAPPGFDHFAPPPPPPSP
ncbi:MAG: thiamine-phosphate kinase [Gemmatimonadetes bacterium]|nr:MAG: thiamine-phosphate kinase [Gemmatimonadota bacterium]